MLIDSHAHISLKEYANDLKDVIKRSFASDTKIINAANSYKTSQSAIELAEKCQGMWAMVGCHPDDVDYGNFDINKYKDLAKSSDKVVAIGEVGLDFYRKDSIDKLKKEQIKVLKQFIKLAKELDLPLVLHCRGEADDPYSAYELMLEIFEKEKYFKGVIHCFGGNLEQAKKFIDLGFYIGFTGIVTFKNAKELQEIVKEVPLDKILIETDAPFLSPEPHRGERNEPAYVKYVAQKIADLKNINFSQIEKQTYDNAKNLFMI